LPIGGLLVNWRAMKHVAVLMGGWSAERPVSLNSGRGCADALEAQGYRVTRVDVDRSIAETLAKLRPDVAFNALHGRVGEDGTIQGVLEILRIPYTHSGVLASALAMQKDLAKIVLQNAGVPVPHGVTVDRHEAARRHVLEPPYVLKPLNEGSSFGVVIVKEDRHHPPQEVGREDWPYGDLLLAERFVDGRELTCAAMGDRVLDIIDIQPLSEAFYGYDAKYAKGGSKHILPAILKPNIYHKVQELTLRAHRALGCRGVSRADFRFDETKGEEGELVCLEVNTQPGMTETSLVPEMAAYAGLSFGELVAWMVEDASCDR
jgi:D-alanine-D-alanine ligase